MAPRAESTYGVDRMDNEDDGSSSFAKKGQQQQAPVEGVSVGFADLTYEVPLQGKGGKNNDEDKLTILHSISGSFLPGKMIALMGPR